MLRKRKVENPGDTELLPGSLVDLMELEDEINGWKRKGHASGCPAGPLRDHQGSLATESFPSASFQETNGS